MPVRAHDLWSLVQDHQYVDPGELADAVQDQVARGDLDFRSRLLIRDSLNALREYWGSQRLTAWLEQCPVRAEIEAICREDLGRVGFPFLGKQLMEPVKPEAVRQFLRELGAQVQRATRLCIGGSIALIVPGYLSRGTQDMDVVDEVPEEIRSKRKLVQELEQRYRLQLAHFQSHYLPSGWENRVHFLDSFGQLRIYLVDVYDVFLSKLFSARTKDRDDLRALVPQLDKDTLIRKLKETTGSMLAAESLRQRAEQNWYILYGEPLPS
jgi:hypothetical protein